MVGHMNLYLMSLVIIVGSTLIIFWTHLNRRLYGDSASPFNLLCWFWLLPLLSRALNLSDLERPWSAGAVAAVSLVTFILVATSLVPTILVPELPALRSRRMVYLRAVATVSQPVFSLLMGVVYGTMLAGTIYVEFVTNPGGLLLVQGLMGSLDTQDAFYNWGKTQGRRPLFTVILTYSALLPLLAAVYYVRYRADQRKWWKVIFFAAAVLPLLLGLLKLSKYDTMVGLLPLLLVSYYANTFMPETGREPRTWTRKMFFAILIVLVVGAMFYSTAAFRVGEELSGTSPILDWSEFKLREVNILNVLAAYIYSYTAFNFENFSRFYEVYSGELNLGTSFFRPFLSLFMQGSVADQMLEKIDFNTITVGLIAGTFMSETYAEMGWLGLILPPAVYGILVNVLYLRFRLNPSMLNFLLYANFAFCWFFLFFANAFATLIFYTNAVGLIGLFGWLKFDRRSPVGLIQSRMAG